MVSFGLYLSVRRMITSICSSVSCTASLCWASHGTYAAQNCLVQETGEEEEVSEIGSVSEHRKHVEYVGGWARRCGSDFVSHTPPPRSFCPHPAAAGAADISHVPERKLCPFSGDTNRCGSNCCATTATRWSGSRRSCACASTSRRINKNGELFIRYSHTYVRQIYANRLHMRRFRIHSLSVRFA